MDTNEFENILDDAFSVAKSYRCYGVADDIVRARDHYRELEASYRRLAEREKALTEALERAYFAGYADAVNDSGEDVEVGK